MSLGWYFDETDTTTWASPLRLRLGKQLYSCEEAVVEYDRSNVTNRGVLYPHTRVNAQRGSGRLTGTGINFNRHVFHVWDGITGSISS